MRHVVCGTILALVCLLGLSSVGRADEASDRFEAAKKRMEERQKAAREAAAKAATQPVSNPTAGGPATKPGAGLALDTLWANLPADVSPDPGHKWDQFSIPKARAWAKARFVGQRASGTVAIQHANVNRVAKEDNPDETESWTLYVRLVQTEAKIGGSAASHTVGADFKENPEIGRLVLKVNEGFAKQSRDWKAKGFM